VTEQEKCENILAGICGGMATAFGTATLHAAFWKLAEREEFWNSLAATIPKLHERFPGLKSTVNPEGT